WYYWLVEKGWAPLPTLAGVDIRQLGLTATTDLAMFGAGGLMVIRAAVSMMIGMILNFVVIVPWMIAIGEIQPRADGTFSRVHVLNTWALWRGTAIMVTAAMTGLFARPQIIISAFAGLFSRRDESRSDVLRHIELPIWISFVGIPIIGAVGVW